jgi:hypothetical protein
MPTVVATQARLADVQRAVLEAESIDACKQSTACTEALQRVKTGYTIAVQSLALASDACSQPDMRGALDMIVKGWTIVRSFLALVGGTGSPMVTDPLVWRDAQ